MRPAFAALVCAVAAAMVVGCGGSSSHKGVAPVVTSTASTTSTSTAPPAATTGSQTSSSGGAAAPTPAATVTTGASSVQLPATFTIGAGGGLSPPSVSAPQGVAVLLTVTSSSGAHRVVLKTSPSRMLSIAAGGRATVVLRGLATGSYPISVDGVVRGSLVVGGSPGP